jgi:hypothetical protein
MDNGIQHPSAHKTPSQLRNEEIARRRLKFVQAVRNDPELLSALGITAPPVVDDNKLADFITFGRRVL